MFRSRRITSLLIVLVAAIALTWVFWWRLWAGGGLVGGDVYSYYFPQKTFYAEQLHAGAFPLWNNRTGWGYPLVGESQTGAWYPPNLLLYASLDVNAAYNVNHILHYVLAFFFAAVYGRMIGLQLAGSLAVALVYTYAWFPARSCVEWAIVGGAWLPAALVCVEGFLQTRWWRWPILLAVVLALQMLAGHFQMAWITQLVVLAYAVGRTTLQRRNATWGAIPSCQGILRTCPTQCEDIDSTSKSHSTSPSSASDNSIAATTRRTSCRVVTAAVVGASVIVAFGLVAAQILPTWELKQRSQRARVSTQHDPNYGLVPAEYLLQTISPWHWYAPFFDRDATLEQLAARRGTRTNMVEAHLYFGLIPLLFGVWSLIDAVRACDRLRLLWAGLGAIALAYAVGWLSLVTRHVPGFNFFEGLGRYTVVTNLAVAVLCGSEWDRISRYPRLPLHAGVLILGALLVTVLSSLSLTGDAAYMARELDAPDPLFGTASNLGAPLVEGMLLVSLLCGLFGFVFWRKGLPRPRSQHTSQGNSEDKNENKDSSVERSGPNGSTSSADTTRRLAPNALDAPTHIGRMLVFVSLLAATVVDLWIVSRLVNYTQLVADSPIAHLQESPVRRVLMQYDGQVRLFAPGANFPTVLGVASVPAYFTFAPRQYAEPPLVMPESPGTDQRGVGSRERIPWLQRVGVTHVLSFDPVAVESTQPLPGKSSPEASQRTEPPGNQRSPQLRLVWRGEDPVLNAAWARFGQPLFLYALEPATSRLRWEPSDKNARAEIQEYAANRVVVDVEVTSPARLVLLDLAFPGWNVSVDGVAAESLTVDKAFRAVHVPAGRHTIVWTYRPASVYWGVIVSLIVAVGLAAAGHLRYWHPDRLPFSNRKSGP